MSFAYTKPRDSLGNIYTPIELSQFIHRTVKHIKPSVVLDPCCGTGQLLEPWLKDIHCHMTVGIDTNDKALNLCEAGQKCCHDFLDLGVNRSKAVIPDANLVLCNPPWNRPPNLKQRMGDFVDLFKEPPETVRSMPERFLRKIVDLYGPEVPIVFLCPMGFRLNQRVISKRWRWLASPEAPQISSIISVPIDLYPDTEFHSEILLFNIPKVKPHYFLDYLIK